ncbi:MAG: CHAP domain-containing protein, partial [Firmicutes bacterium]|nr:CHAP domain-containing protein [Bacillota bacterium]
MRRTFIILLLAAIMCLAVALPALAVDDYPATYKNLAKDAVIDEWGFYNRECVSFVAWCLNSRNQIYFHNTANNPWWGNANTWDDTARALGYRVDNTPARGAVAYWDEGYYGHVAWVSAVDGNNVTIEEYNYDHCGNYHTRTIPVNEPHGYIHIKDL